MENPATFEHFSMGEDHKNYNDGVGRLAALLVGKSFPTCEAAAAIGTEAAAAIDIPHTTRSPSVPGAAAAHDRQRPNCHLSCGARFWL